MSAPLLALLAAAVTLEPEAAAAGWLVSSDVLDRDGTLVNFIVAVKQQNIAQLKARALSSSTPGDAQYGRHLSAAQIVALTAPSDEDLTVVTRYLDLHNVTGYHIDNEAVHASVSADRFQSGRSAASASSRRSCVPESRTETRHASLSRVGRRSSSNATSTKPLKASPLSRSVISSGAKKRPDWKEHSEFLTGLFRALRMRRRILLN